MTEHWISEPDSSHPQGLALSLVDGGGEGLLNWELTALPLECVFSQLGNEGDPGNENSSVGSYNLTLEQLVVEDLLIDQLSSIAKSLSWVQISHQHEWHTRFEGQYVSWNSIRCQGVDVFSVESECILWVIQAICTA